ncbi:glyoxalase [Microgenomates group bacterium RIFCSPLOWO2_01_FULL_46_13]|nr:MAG: glyoxalase [Microgenomates group bacterium RIFCSPHIGHO2_01_FULL_45_11]OGV94916.1 MAG: glyoxalase [Microgenomates group bacterium RIFCSPLOWO2_01_FULL_46_13]
MDKVVHFEIPADDVKRAQTFYQTVFGWGINEMPEMNYTIVHTVEVDEKQMPKESGAINGGMLKRQEPITNPVITISVASIDETTKMIETGGGKVIRPKMAVGDMGFAAYFKDSEGNVIGLWENAKPATS